MAPSKVRALLRLERVALVSRAFREAWRGGRISWTQAEAMAPLLVLAHSGPWHPKWIDRARRVTVRRLRDDVDQAVASDALDPAVVPALPEGLQTGALPRARGGNTQVFFAAPRDVARLFRAAGGSDDPENCTTLCAWHHLRAGLPALVTYASGDLTLAA